MDYGPIEPLRGSAFALVPQPQADAQFPGDAPVVLQIESAVACREYGLGVGGDAGVADAHHERRPCQAETGGARGIVRCHEVAVVERVTAGSRPGAVARPLVAPLAVTVFQGMRAADGRHLGLQLAGGGVLVGARVGGGVGNAGRVAAHTEVRNHGVRAGLLIHILRQPEVARLVGQLHGVSRAGVVTRHVETDVQHVGGVDGKDVVGAHALGVTQQRVGHVPPQRRVVGPVVFR